MALKRKKEEGSCSSADSADSIKLKPKRKQISASTSERPNMHWEADWNMPFLDLLDDICKGRERSIGRAFDNAFWRAFAPLFCTKINRSGITAEDCKERTKFFEKKFRDYKGDTPTAEDRKIASVYRRDPVPKVPRAPADFGASGEASSSRSRSRARSRPRSTASCGPSPELNKVPDDDPLSGDSAEASQSSSDSAEASRSSSSAAEASQSGGDTAEALQSGGDTAEALQPGSDASKASQTGVHAAEGSLSGGDAAGGSQPV